MRNKLFTLPKKILGTALAAVLLPLLAPTTGAAAQAAADVCRSGYFCIYEHSGFVGRYWAFPSNVHVGYVGDFMNDRMTSFKNYTTVYACLYETANYGHKMSPHGLGAIPPGYWTSNVNPFSNDKLSSIRFTSTYDCD
ncbi:hypothetical protein DMB66_12430 [Actinoplanes sp. ATCC 53533]|uniref:peptidase inhibitor family I36 protein n=1 Tax=Actinoplanes sp. ATCC 53533 TaxID=1288362 RepID=UPI000F7B6BA3|nr:peptidase inhibitor family I36 protein [Actinoplanes sp. ATCC 53533]RSM68770.1 hypothetical protein DMB66_12430 [Actinoplanes sp. ATCC 53533]